MLGRKFPKENVELFRYFQCSVCADKLIKMGNQESSALILVKARIERGLSTQEVANLLGISRRYLAKFENGEREISKPLLPKFAELYGAAVVEAWRRERFDDRETLLDWSFLDSLVVDVDIANESDIQSAVKRRCGNYLKRERLKLSWTANTAATKHGVPPATWSDWENGKTVPNSKGMLKLIHGPLHLHRMYAAWWHWPIMWGSKELPGEIGYSIASDQFGLGFLSTIASRHSSCTTRDLRLGRFSRDGISAALRCLLMFHQYGEPQYLADLATSILDHREKHPDDVLPVLKSHVPHHLFAGLQVGIVIQDLEILARYTSDELDLIIGACSDAIDSHQELMRRIRRMPTVRDRYRCKSPLAGLECSSREVKYNPIGSPPVRHQIGTYILRILEPQLERRRDSTSLA